LAREPQKTPDALGNRALQRLFHAPQSSRWSKPVGSAIQFHQGVRFGRTEMTNRAWANC
jgi:hypothetical protein